MAQKKNNIIEQLRKEALLDGDTELDLPDGTKEIFTFYADKESKAINCARYSAEKYGIDGTFVEKKYGYVWDWGWVTDVEWDDATPLSGLVGAVRQDDKWFFVWADTGERVDEQEYDDIAGPYLERNGCFTEFFSFAKKEWGAGRGMTDERGKVVFMPIYDTMPIRLEDKTYLARKDGKNGIINRRGETLVPFGEYKSVAKAEEKKYQYILDGYGNIIKTHSREGTGICTREGEEIIPCIYEHLDLLKSGSEDLLIAALDGMWGVINLANEIVVPFKYDEIEQMSRLSDRVVVLQNGKWREEALSQICVK